MKLWAVEIALAAVICNVSANATAQAAPSGRHALRRIGE